MRRAVITSYSIHYTKLYDKETLFGDFGLDVAVGGTGNGHADRTGSTVTGETNDSHVVSEVLPAELGADAKFVGGVEQFLP